jgi:hypothetical protein
MQTARTIPYMGTVRAIWLGLLVALAVAASASAAAWTVLRANGVALRAPSGWELVPVAETGSVVDPRTVLVAGTEGTAPRRSECQVAAYRVPVEGAAVVVIRWAGRAPEWLPTDRDVLAELRLRRAYFECFDGRGASAQIASRGRAYQVNVMVGDRASAKTVATALAVARSFDTVR